MKTIITNLTMCEVISNRLAAISLRDLLLVEAVARFKGFRPAAEVMGISASGLSHQVRKVELALGHDIFERGQKVSLTKAGQQTLEVIEKVLGTMAALESPASDGGRLLGPMLRLGIISSLAPSNLLRLMALCEAHSPGTEIELISGKHHGLMRRLMEREIDVLITADPTPPENCRATPLFEEDFILLSRADKEKTAFPSSEDDFAPQSALDHLGATSSAWLKRAYGISIEQRIALVEAGYGTTLIPRNWLELDRLPAALTIKPANGRRCFSAVWRQSYALGEALQRMFATH